MKVNTDASQFMRDMQNVVNYSIGFLEGAQNGKQELLKNIGEQTIEILNAYIDSNARINPSLLQHVYEWEMSGSPSNRLFDIAYTVRGDGLSIGNTFRQSLSIKRGSNVPFYDKARIMEQGVPVVISPKPSGVLSFEDDNGNMVFTKKPVLINNPGGDQAAGGFQRVVDDFFNNYFSQAFLNASGILRHLTNPIEYNISRSKGGKSAGRTSGYKWITKAIG